MSSGKIVIAASLSLAMILLIGLLGFFLLSGPGAPGGLPGEIAEPDPSPAPAERVAVETVAPAASEVRVGAGSFRIMLRHVLPNIVGPILVEGSLRVGHAILAEAALSFLGLGVPPPEPSWGSMLLGAQPYLRSDAWMALFPGFAIIIAVLGFNLLGDGLRDAIDPKLRGQSAI